MEFQIDESQIAIEARRTKNRLAQRTHRRRRRERQQVTDMANTMDSGDDHETCPSTSSHGRISSISTGSSVTAATSIMTTSENLSNFEQDAPLAFDPIFPSHQYQDQSWGHTGQGPSSYQQSDFVMERAFLASQVVAQHGLTNGFDSTSKILFDQLSSVLDSDSLPVGAHLPLDSQPPVRLEDRIGHVLHAADGMGFENFDVVITDYYTAKFRKGSLPFYAQSASRSRRLRQFLIDLHESSKTWTGKEAQGYHEERVLAMERSYEEEFQQLAETGLCSNEVEIRKRAFVGTMINQLFEDETTKDIWKRDRQYLREQVPGIWSLLSNLARNLNVSDNDISQAICVFLYMLKVIK
ncbi:uncharacterized protein EKO05_0009065 [Ascochyta rabiei]|uniref:uncharacterized protein n=1 Tax=Didymella rabiei TaxID=5454 RepID=UPI00190230D3|nr:uncharacterized protein EKO05_0009065 [Ascochyta rabiei]UPX18774.1 hypothetical protein EKO05_0009065 [Ascochyta rabiei]